MQYWLSQLIYVLRRSVPLYADDNSRIYTAYSSQLLKQLMDPNITPTKRNALFLHFSEHFIGDISGERLAHSISNIENPIAQIETFQKQAWRSKRPRALILLEKTKTALTEEYNYTFPIDEDINFNWSKEQELKFSEGNLTASRHSTFALRCFYVVLRIWRFFFRSKNTSLFAHSIRQGLLEKLSRKDIHDSEWLLVFEEYAYLFNEPTDIAIMAENLKLRHPARDLALLDFTYRVHRNKRKALLFLRRVKLVLAGTINGSLPEYRGTDLTTLFFNPVEAKRQKIRLQKIEANKARAEKSSTQRAKIREANLIKREKTLKARMAKVEANKARAEKSNTQRAKIRETNLIKREKALKTRIKKVEINKARAERVRKKRDKNKEKKFTVHPYIAANFLKTNLNRLLNRSYLDEYEAAQLNVTTDIQEGKEFKYSPVNRKLIRANTELAILSMTGRVDEFLDISLLDGFSRVIVLNSTSLKHFELHKKIESYIGSDVEIECFSPAQLLIKPYTQVHQNISDYADNLSMSLVNQVLELQKLSEYFENSLKEDYILSLSDSIFRSIERFHAAQLFFETIPKDTPVFFNAPQDNFRFALAKLGFTKIIILNSGKFIGKTRDWTSLYKTTTPSKWFSKLKAAYRTIDLSIQNLTKTHSIPQSKQNKIIIATNTRSSIHRVSTEKTVQILSEHYDIQTLDISANAPRSAHGDNFHSITQHVDRELKSNLHTAFSPVISKTLTDLPLGSRDMVELTPEITAIAVRNTGLLLAQTSLYRTLKQHYASPDKAVAILIPGRYAAIRTAARAFHSLGLPTIDLQLLFLSKMARYKAPITTHQLVIDKATQDFYVHNYGIIKDKIGIIGSLTRDEDIQQAVKFGRGASLEHFKLSQHQSIITLACQPGFETVTEDSTRILAEYIKSNEDICICVKLHPAQNSSHFETLENIFKTHIPENMANRWRVIHKDPFWKIIPATNILISYFSNVCLQACAFGIPVLSLPGGGPRPAPDFEALGVAHNVKSLKELPSQITNLLAMSKNNREKQPPHKYIKDNPHMADDKSLHRLKSYVDKLMQEQ